jgi:pilus assembly protein CpaB
VALRNFLIAAGCVALLAGFVLATVWISRSPATPGAAQAAPPLPGILLAARPVAGGTLLQPADVVWGPAGPAGAPPGAIVRGAATENEFLGAVTRQAFATGEPFMENALVKPGDRTFLAAVLMPGFRAISIAVDAPQSVAGLVLPGDRVDLILTQNFGNGASDPGRKSVGETVLRDIRVVAVDQSLMTVAKPAVKDARMGAANSPIPGTITLEVTEPQAERVLVAMQLGKVQPAVRSLVEADATDAALQRSVTATWAADVSPALSLLAGRAPPPPGVSATPPRAGPTSFSTEVMRGSKTSIE